jgi:hypothetical protein
MSSRFNYDSPKSLEVIGQICAFLLGRPLHGATQHEIAEMLGVSHGTANRFIQHLCSNEVQKIHIAIQAKATQRGHRPAIYKYGPRTVTIFPRNAVYQDLPLSFFGARKKK